MGISFTQRLKQKWPTTGAFFRSHWGVAVILAVVTLGVFAPVLFLHQTTFFTNLDNVDQFYTWYQKFSVAWHHGYIPFWNANEYAGASFAGELQTGLLYPVNWIWIALFGSGAGISELALNYLVALHFWAAAFGAYLLIRKLGARRWAALLAGATFAFSGAVAFRAISQTVIFFGLAAIPYVLFFALKYRDNLRKRWLVLSGIALGSTLLMGHIQPFFHAVLALALLELMFVCREWKGWSRFWGTVWPALKRLIIVGLSAAVITLPQLYLSAQYLPHAYRIQASGYVGPGEKVEYGPFSKAFNVEPHEFANLLDPVSYMIRDGNNIFIGLAPLTVLIIMLVFARVRLRKTELWKRYGFWVTALLLVSVLAMLGYVTWFAVVLYKLPLVYEIRQLGRYAVLFDLALVIVLAAALPAVAGLRFGKRQRRWLLAAGLCMVLNAAYLFALRHHVLSLHNSLQWALAGLTVLLLAVVASPRLRAYGLSVLLLATASVNTLWYMPNVTATTKLPTSYALPTALTKILTDTNGRYRVEDSDGALPLNLGNVYPVQMTGGYSATIYQNYYRINNSTIDHGFIQDILGVQLQATKQPPKQGALVYQDRAHAVYVAKRATALPKAFVSDVTGSLNRADYHGLPVATKSYNDRYQKFEIKLDAERDIILSEMAYPGWAAQVDGKKASLGTYSFGSYPLFKMLHLTAGTHTVELTYKPFGVF